MTDLNLRFLSDYVEDTDKEGFSKNEKKTEMYVVNIFIYPLYIFHYFICHLPQFWCSVSCLDI